MQKNRFSLLLLLSLGLVTLFSCKSEEVEYPKTVNIKFDITSTGSPETYVTTTINNNENEEFVSAFPYSMAITQVQAELGTYVKLTLQDDTNCSIVQSCDHTTELSISVDNEVVKSELFNITESVEVVFIDYTFE